MGKKRNANQGRFQGGFCVVRGRAISATSASNDWASDASISEASCSLRSRMAVVQIPYYPGRLNFR